MRPPLYTDKEIDVAITQLKGSSSPLVLKGATMLEQMQTEKSDLLKKIADLEESLETKSELIKEEGTISVKRINAITDLVVDSVDQVLTKIQTEIQIIVESCIKEDSVPKVDVAIACLKIVASHVPPKEIPTNTIN